MESSHILVPIEAKFVCSFDILVPIKVKFATEFSRTISQIVVNAFPQFVEK